MNNSIPDSRAAALLAAAGAPSSGCSLGLLGAAHAQGRAMGNEPCRGIFKLGQNNSGNRDLTQALKKQPPPHV